MTPSRCIVSKQAGSCCEDVAIDLLGLGKAALLMQGDALPEFVQR